MKQYNAEKAKKRIIAFLQRCNLFEELMVLEDGRIIVPTDLFFHSDQTIQDAPEATEDNNPVVEEEITFTQLEQMGAAEQELFQEDTQDFQEDTHKQQQQQQ